MPASVGVGVAAIIRHPDDDSILLMQRKGTHGTGLWAPPGGWVDVVDGQPETPSQAAVREVHEETGLTVRTVPEHRSRAWRYRLTWRSGDDGTHSYCIWVRCFYDGGEPTIMEPEKCAELAWVPVGELEKLPLFWHLAEFLETHGRMW